ncbi:Squalene monooxygenase SE1 [Linum perenne]
MRHPSTSRGMTVALSDIFVLRDLLGPLGDVFSTSPDEARKEMREACFDYLSMRGVCSSGPMALLSGLNPRPLSFVLQFFAMAIYVVGRLLLSFPFPKGFWFRARLITVCIQD